MTKCEVDHEERRLLGFEGCYKCWATLQTPEEAKAIKAAPPPPWRYRTAFTGGCYVFMGGEFIDGRMVPSFHVADKEEAEDICAYLNALEKMAPGIVGLPADALAHETP